ncbi:MAG: hypothetical protein LBE12_00005 [Planctomycetaceae bacterium]|nr:hypothetical protein [Planctomycetaceae bacterium]
MRHYQLSTINYQLNRLPFQGDSGKQLFCNKNRNLKCNEYRVKVYIFGKILKNT